MGIIASVDWGLVDRGSARSTEWTMERSDVGRQADCCSASNRRSRNLRIRFRREVGTRTFMDFGAEAYTGRDFDLPRHSHYSGVISMVFQHSDTGGKHLEFNFTTPYSANHNPTQEPPPSYSIVRSRDRTHLVDSPVPHTLRFARGVSARALPEWRYDVT